MLGYDPAEFHETNAAWIERLHPEDREPVAAIYRGYIAGEIPKYQVEFRQPPNPVTEVDLSLGKIVEWDGRGEPLRMLGTHTNITERKLAEEALRDLSSHQKPFCRHSEIIMEVDTYKVYTWANQAGLDSLVMT